MKQLVQWWQSKPAARVIGCGALGGILIFFDPAISGTFAAPWYFALPSNLLMGGAAAFVAVYVLLGIDTQDLLRSCGVALLAGHFWSPVFDAGKEYVLAQPERAAEADADTSATELDTGTTRLEAGAADANLVRKTGEQAESLAEKAAYLRPGPVKTRVIAAISRSLDAISAKAGKDDADALGSMANVGEIAAKSGNPRLSEKAWTSISKIPVTQGSPVDKRKSELRARLPVMR